jgi:hypothetical protein
VFALDAEHPVGCFSRGRSCRRFLQLKRELTPLLFDSHAVDGAQEPQRSVVQLEADISGAKLLAIIAVRPAARERFLDFIYNGNHLFVVSPQKEQTA